MAIRNIQVVRLENDNYENIYFYCVSGSSGFHEEILNIINTKKNELVRFYMERPEGDVFKKWSIGKSNNFDKEEFNKEKKYLENIARKHGFVTKEEIEKSDKNPEYAFYFWNKDNGEIKDGVMNIRKYKGKEKYPGSVAAEIKYNKIRLTSYFKSGIIAYDEEKDEHFALFHPNNRYNWSSHLEIKYPYLFVLSINKNILNIVNLKSNYLKRYENVKNVKVSDNKITVDNNEEIPFPVF